LSEKRIAFVIDFQNYFRPRMNITKQFILGTVLGLGLASGVMAGSTNQIATNQPVVIDVSDERARVSYAVGMMTGMQWKKQGLDFDADAFAQGLKDAIAGGKTLLTDAEAQNAVMNFKGQFASYKQKLQAQLAAKNKVVSDAFLSTNKHNPGVITLPSGLQYQVITKGSGVIPAVEDRVTVHYRGTLLDGTEFDDSIKRGQPFQVWLGVDRVIAGWTEALKMMPVGSKWKLFIPAELAYGEQGRQGVIPPNAALIFEVEVLGVTPAPPKPSTPITSDIIKMEGTNVDVIKADDAAKGQKK
jgi:FKBP-type peptidyl-prolyl cis-trans isomerase